MAGPGDDNVTGGNDYTLNLGVEPDLGGVLQNLNVVNDLLDQAQDKFRSISDVVGSTTAKMNQLTRATSLFVTETQRAKNEYQRLATLQTGAPGGGGIPTSAPQVPVSPVAQAALAGQWGGQGAGMYAPNTQYGPGGGGGGGGGAGLPPVGGIGGGQAPRQQMPFNMRVNAIESNVARWTQNLGRMNTGPDYVQALGQRFNLGFAARGGQTIEPNTQEWLANQFNNGPQSNVDIANDLYQRAEDIPGLQNSLEEAGFFPGGEVAPEKVEDLGNLVGKLGNTAGGSTVLQGSLTRFGAGGGRLASAAGTAGNILKGATVPLLAATAAMYGISAGNRMINAPLSAAVGYTGMTGGTSATGFGAQGGFGQSAMGYQQLARNLSGEHGWGPLQLDFNAAVTKEQANQMINAMLSSGYATEGGLTTGSLAREGSKGSQALGFMEKQASKGFQDMNEAMSMWIQNVDEMGGSTEDLTKTMDSFRKIATQTDVGVAQLTKNFNEMNAQFSQFGGISGRQATQFARTAAARTSGATVASVRGTGMAPTPSLYAMTAAQFGMAPGALEAAVGFGKIGADTLQGEMARQSKSIVSGLLGGRTPASEEELQQMIMESGLGWSGWQPFAAQFGIQTEDWPALASKMWEAYYDKDALANIPRGPVPQLALGDVVTSPTLAIIGESGPEVVSPLASSSITSQLEKAQYRASGIGTSQTSMPPFGDSGSSTFDVPDEYYKKLGDQFTHALDKSNRIKATRDEARRRRPNWDVS